MSDESGQPEQSSDAKTPMEAAVETFIYAPIGLLFEGASLLPQLIEKGRNQVNMARMIGKFAVDQAGAEATKASGKLQDQAAGLLDFIGGGITPTTTDPEPARKAKPKATGPRPDAGAAREAARKVAGAAAQTAARTVDAAVAAANNVAVQAIDAASLAIPDYDGLSASHVVNRLAGLSAVELESVRLYELANRGRKTILSKVAQLQSS